MRLFLLPISTRRTLIYCQRLNQVAQERQTLIDRLTARAANTWLQWERGDKNWQKAIVNMGNKVMRGIPYEEWGLKSIPPLSTRRRGDALSEEKRTEKEKVDVAFPPRLIPPDRVGDVLRKLATERQTLHARRMWWSIVGMPISAPIALIPIVPNVPFFYLLFRAWSHWRALSGSKHLEYLLENKLIRPTPSSTLDKLYEASHRKLAGNSNPEDSRSSPGKTYNSPHPAGQVEENGQSEVVLLQKSDGKLCADALGVPELAVEVERAVEQVEKAILKSSGQTA